MRIIFFGTAKFGVETLKVLAREHEVLKVITGEPKKSGRGHLLNKNPIQLFAEELELNVLCRQKPVAEDITEEFDIGVVVAYGALISRNILEKAKFGFLNLHPSDLPLFRGASPIERTLEAGFESTRICVIKMTPKLDDGDIVVSEKYQIKPSQNSIDLHEDFAAIGAKLILKAIEILPTGEGFEKQNDSKATYAKKIHKEELQLEPMKFTTKQILDKIRAFASYGFPYIIYNGKRIKIKEALILNERSSLLDLECTDGFVHPTIIKPEGKNFININNYIA